MSQATARAARKSQPAGSKPKRRSPSFSVAGTLGSEIPTIYTPPKRKLTCKTTHGYEVIQFAETVLKLQLYPWQKWMLIHALELKPNGQYRFRTVVLLVGRQNGKSLLLQVWTLWRMYVDHAPLTIGTAQNLDIAETHWEAVVDLAEANEYLASEIQHVDRTSGKKALRLKSKEKYRIAAATRRGGRGLSGDLVILDELREHANWDSWSAVTKTTLARERPQILCASNAGDATSIVLRHLRTKALDAIREETTDSASIGLFEWSAVRWDPKAGKDQGGDWVNIPASDRRGWPMSNPSLNHGFLTSEALEDAYGTDPMPVFQTECLCQWIVTGSGGAFEDGLWEKLRDPESEIVGGFYYGLDVSWDRTTTTVTVAGRRMDGRVHVEPVTSRTGTDWVVPWFKKRIGKEGLLGVVLQSKGAPVSSLLEDLQNCRDEQGNRLNVVEWGGTDLGPGTGQFYDLVRQDGLRHRGQPILDLAVALAAMRPVGEYWLWDRKKSPVDITALIGATAAVWALQRPEVEEQTSAYDDEELMFV